MDPKPPGLAGKDPVLCPLCGSLALYVFVTDWQARSLDPCDPENVVTIDEHQCAHCARSFWT